MQFNSNLITVATSVKAEEVSTTTIVQVTDLPMDSNKSPDAPVKSSHKDGPQCCHCGWRGDHAPDCPFR